MNLLDKIIGAFSPRAGAERQYYRQLIDTRSHYDAAASGRLQSQWTVHNEPAEFENEFDRNIIRARARDLERNSDIENAALRSYRRNIPGAGIHLRPLPPTQKQTKQLSELWQKWIKAKNCDVTGTQSLPEMFRMLIQRKIVDGGILVIKRYTKYGIIPFQLQCLEVDALDNSQMVPHTEGNRVIGGVEVNSFGRPEGYWIKQVQPDGFGVAPSIYLEAKDVIYYFTKHRPTQVREISDMAPTITRVKDVDEYMNAETVKEKIAASLAVFIKKTNPATGTYGRNGNTSGPQVMYQGKRIVPGMIMEMNPGDEAQFLEPKSTGTDATSFVKLNQRMISAGQGLSYEAMTRDMSGTNYSSARQGLIEDDLTYDEEREGFIKAFLDEVYETFVISAWLSGKFDAPDFWENKDKYFEHQWVMNPKRWIDPSKESSATKTALQTGQKTFQQVCAENGRDWKAVIDEFAESQKYGETKGINLAQIIFGKDIEELEQETESEPPVDGDKSSENDGGEENKDGKENGNGEESGSGSSDESKGSDGEESSGQE